MQNEQNDNAQILQQFVDKELEQISPLEKVSIDLKQRVDATQIRTDEELAEAVKLRKEITGHISGTGKFRLDLTRPLDKVKEQFIAGERKVLAPAEEAKTDLGKKIMAYEEVKAEAARKEQARIDEIISHFGVREALNTKKITPIDTRGAELKAYYAALPEADQEIPQIKLAFTQAINELLETRQILSKAKEDEAAAERARLTRKANEAEAAAAVQAEAKAAPKAPKTGIKMVRKITITDPAAVPRQYCEPNMQMIRDALDAGVKEIAGVTVTMERSF